VKKQMKLGMEGEGKRKEGKQAKGWGGGRGEWLYSFVPASCHGSPKGCGIFFFFDHATRAGRCLDEERVQRSSWYRYSALHGESQCTERSTASFGKVDAKVTENLHCSERGKIICAFTGTPGSVPW
jgi:hypothetical protein